MAARRDRFRLRKVGIADSWSGNPSGVGVGAAVQGADPGMVKSAPEHGKSDKPMVAKPPPEGMDPGIHAPGANLSGTPTPPK